MIANKKKIGKRKIKLADGRKEGGNLQMNTERSKEGREEEGKEKI